MKEIIAGVRQFQRDVFPEHRELFERLAGGQSPGAMLIACSDSRIDPFLLTQSRPGDLFVVRNAGNFVPPFDRTIGAEAAAIEYAVITLRVKDIIICGHSDCGAMHGLVDPARLRDLPSVAQWLRHAQQVRASLLAAGGLNGPDALERAIEANVLAQLDNLRTHPTVASAVNAGRLQLHGWVYHIATGEVAAYDDERHEFRPL
jgi:carbonic anhydrase